MSEEDIKSHNFSDFEIGKLLEAMKGINKEDQQTPDLCCGIYEEKKSNPCDSKSKEVI
jgi:hypothetical protein